MTQKHRKVCRECLREFENEGSRNCPCGSDRWNFINETGGVFVPIQELMNGKPGPNGEVFIDPEYSRRKMRELAIKYHMGRVTQCR